MALAVEYTCERLFPADSVHPKFVLADGYRTHYVESGPADARPVVLLHGGACSIGWGLDRWYPVVPALARSLRVFALDELGHGKTDAPRDLNELGDTVVRSEHAIAFIEALNVGPVHLVGQSQGAMIATYITLKRPDLVRKLVIVDSASTSGVEVGKITSDSKLLPYNKNIFEPGTRIPKDDMRTREGIRRHISEFFYDTTLITEPLLDNALELSATWHDRYVKRDREIWGSGEVEGLRSRQRQYSVNGKHISESVHEIVRPTLVVWGKQSNKGVDGGVELFKKISDAQMHIFDKANHFVWMDRPKEFNSLVSWYLEES